MHPRPKYIINYLTDFSRGTNYIMKIAVISDIHGNMQALNAVLDNIKTEKCDKIFCLGDLAMAGPEPSKTIEKTQKLIESTDFTCIQGNTDEVWQSGKIHRGSPDLAGYSYLFAA